jgi:PST family polysaccharide transporter
VGFNLVNYFARNADAMLIGRFLGPSELGLYNIGYRLMLFPLQNLTSIVNRAFYPVYSRQQHNPAVIGGYYLKTLSFISFVTAPLMLGLWAVREPFVTGVLGETWLGSAAIIAWLAPTGYLQSLLSTTGTVLMATGRTDLLRSLGAGNALLYLAAFIIGLNDGAVGVARAYFFANIAAALISFHYTLRLVALDLTDAVNAIIRSVAGALVMAAIVMGADIWLSQEIDQVIVRLVCLGLLGAGVYAGLLLVLSPDSFRQVKRLLTERLQ